MHRRRRTRAEAERSGLLLLSDFSSSTGRLRNARALFLLLATGAAFAAAVVSVGSQLWILTHPQSGTPNARDVSSAQLGNRGRRTGAGAGGHNVSGSSLGNFFWESVLPVLSRRRHGPGGPNEVAGKIGRTVNSQLPDEEQFDHVDEGVAACLCLMDDNHWLIEWLAFHYHVLPLRTLVVVRDPHSKTTPMPILERWKSYMNITVWDDAKFVKSWVLRQHKAGKMPQWRLHRYRQQFFYPACLRALKSASRQASAPWVLLVDTDELVSPNLHYPWPSGGNGLDLSSPGAVLRSVKEFERGVDPARRPACLHIPRLQMSARTMDASDAEAIQSVLQHRDFVNSSHLLTTSWFYHAGKEISTGHDHLDGKNLINVGRIEESNIPAKTSSVHHVLPDVCPVKVRRNETPIIIHHFLGTLAQYTSRSDPRDSIQGRPARDQTLYESYKGKVKDMSLVAWLPGFIQSVGAAEAQRLLEGVGKVQQ